MVNWDCDLDQNPIIHIGYPKCASSTLQNSLFPNWGDICFAGGRSEFKGDDRSDRAFDFVVDVMEKDSLEFRPDELRKRYAKVFTGVSKPVLISNEAMAFGSYFGGKVDRLEVANRVKKLVPDADILVVIRNQLEMLPSLFAEVLKSEGFTKRDFSTWLEEQWEKRGYQGYLHLLKFHDLIENYVERFGRDSVHVIVLENLGSDPGNVVNRLVDLVRVNEDSREKMKQLLSEERNTRITEFERFFYPTYNFLSGLKWLRGLIRPLKKQFRRLRRTTGFTISTRIQPEIPDEWRVKLTDYYRRSNANLVDTLNVKGLEDHGYPL